MTKIKIKRNKPDAGLEPILPQVLFSKGGKQVCLRCGKPMLTLAREPMISPVDVEEDAAPRQVSPVRFEHVKSGAAKKCPPQALRKLKQFTLSKRSFDFRVRDKNEALLNEPSHKQIYEAVFKSLSFALTRQAPTPDLWKAAQLAFGSQSFVQDHPWAAAFDAFYTMQLMCKRSGHKFSFVGEGHQELEYFSLNKIPGIVVLPQQITLMMRTKLTQGHKKQKEMKWSEPKPVYNPTTGKQICFAVSKQSALDLVVQEQAFAKSSGAARPFSEPLTPVAEFDVA